MKEDSHEEGSDVLSADLEEEQKAANQESDVELEEIS
jgi:hypothetical protein